MGDRGWSARLSTFGLLAMVAIAGVTPSGAVAAAPAGTTAVVSGCATVATSEVPDPQPTVLSAASSAPTVGSQEAAVSASGGVGHAAMVRDIDTSGSSFPQHLTQFRGGVAFSARDDAYGRELYFAVGTAAKRLGDLRPGVKGSDPQGLKVIGSTLFFSANDGSHGRELWKTDGTGPGTRRVRDIRPGAKGSSPTHLTVFKDKVFFAARDGSHGRELWRSDGTRAGTVMVKDIQANGSSLYSSGLARPDRWAVLKGYLYFGVQFDHLGLWRTDGTRNGTKRVFADVYPQALAATSVRLYFQGLTAGCSADDVVYVSDGTSAGTHMVANDYGAGALLTFQGRAYWAQRLSANVTRLFRSSGTWAASGPVMPIVKVDGIDAIRAIGGALFLSQDHGLSISDGYGVHTHKLGDTSAGFTGLVDVAKLGDLWYFPGGMDGHAHDLWQTDGTPEGTQLAATVVPEGSPNLSSLVRSNGAIWFAAHDEDHGWELWRYVP